MSSEHSVARLFLVTLVWELMLLSLLLIVFPKGCLPLSLLTIFPALAFRMLFSLPCECACLRLKNSAVEFLSNLLGYLIVWFLKVSIVIGIIWFYKSDSFICSDCSSFETLLWPSSINTEHWDWFLSEMEKARESAPLVTLEVELIASRD